jgi:ferritin
MANQGSAGIQTKGLTILEDQMQHEFLACKKAEQYAKTLTNPSLQTLANDLAMKHRTHFDRLFNYLNSHA